MCGIAAIYNFHPGTLHHDAIRRMTREIAHRGPDADGLYVNEHVALGHRRISIIDTSAASNQPLWDHSGRYAIHLQWRYLQLHRVNTSASIVFVKTVSDTVQFDYRSLIRLS
jgi:asparagine synthetase B (glutamine-hydrolysing)